MSTQRLVVGLSLAVMIPACGGGSSSSTPVTTTTTTVPCVQTILFQNNGPVPARTLIPLPFTFNATARLDVILDWTSPSSPMGVYAVQGACDLGQFNARTCNFLIRSEPSTVKPRRVSASNVAPGSYALYIANFADQDESAAVQIISSSATCAPLSAAAPTAQGSAPTVSRMVRR